MQNYLMLFVLCLAGVVLVAKIMPNSYKSPFGTVMQGIFTAYLLNINVMIGAMIGCVAWACYLVYLSLTRK